MRGLSGRGRWTIAALTAAAVFAVSSCELKPPATNQAASPSPVASPSPSPPPTPVAITAPSFHSGEVTVAYAPVALAATGGTPPYQWTVGAGALPGGLTLSSDGSVSGTPSAAGSFSFTAHVADTGSRSADVSASISIVAAPSAGLTSACAQYCAVEQGCDSSCGTFGSLSGGTAPFSYTLQAGGFVPHGVSVLGLALAGTFTAPAKFWQFTVVVTDSLGATTSITPTFYVYPHISLGGSATCSTSFYLTGCTGTLPYADGTPGGTPSVKITGAQGSYCPPPNYGCGPSTSPPPGFTATASGGTVSISIPPQARPGYAYRGTVSLILVDQSQCASGTSCSSGTATVSVNVALG